jgi:hypothetical protein
MRQHCPSREQPVSKHQDGPIFRAASKAIVQLQASNLHLCTCIPSYMLINTACRTLWLGNKVSSFFFLRESWRTYSPWTFCHCLASGGGWLEAENCEDLRAEHMSSLLVGTVPRQRERAELATDACRGHRPRRGDPHRREIHHLV